MRPGLGGARAGIAAVSADLCRLWADGTDRGAVRGRAALAASASGWGWHGWGLGRGVPDGAGLALWVWLAGQAGFLAGGRIWLAASGGAGDA